MYIGIDLGTTNSAISGNTNSDLRIFKTAEGMDTLPSVIYIDKRGHRLYGKKAYNQTLLSPDNVAAGFKRLMGTSTKIDLKAVDITLSPEECSAEILRQLIAQAFTESGIEEIKGIVITIPAAFNQMQSEATLQAARLAGLSQVALLQEPIAAAMTAMAQAKNKSGQFLVYDLGGGTFDLALVQGLSGAINIIAHEGINMLGGRDFDRSIVNTFVRPWLLKNFDLPNDFQKNAKYKRILEIARLAAEKAKIDLSYQDLATIFATDEEIRMQDEKGKDIYLEVELKLKNLEDLIGEDITRTIELTSKILRDNGYSHNDIDRIVFVGGPTKMPYIRNRVSQELGIPADLQVDPMTAVALGASIYAESREWDGKTTKRKTTRASKKISEHLDIKYDYPSRTSDDKAKIYIKVGSLDENNRLEIEVDSSQGWTSGRKVITSDTSVKVPLSSIGNNDFSITVFDATGKPLKDTSTQFTITRTYATSAGIPATQTIAVKVKENSGAFYNILYPIIIKGSSLPAQGIERFAATRDLKSGDKNEYLDFELFQDEGAKEPELNLCIGVFRVSGSDLEAGMKIREGDEIVFHWEMSDSGILQVMLELPSVGQTFETPKFYVAQAGHQTFDLESGSKIAKNVLTDTETELEELREIVEDKTAFDIAAIEKDLEKQKQELQNASDTDTIRSVTEFGRYIRQAISQIRHTPENKGLVLRKELDKLKHIFNDQSREFVDEKSQELFDRNAQHANDCIDRGSDKDIRDAESNLNVLRDILTQGIWRNPEALINMFRNAESASHLATDKEEYNILLEEGVAAIEENDSDKLRSILMNLHNLQIRIGKPKSSLDKLASIIRFTV